MFRVACGRNICVCAFGWSGSIIFQYSAVAVCIQYTPSPAVLRIYIYIWYEFNFFIKLVRIYCCILIQHYYSVSSSSTWYCEEECNTRSSRVPFRCSLLPPAPSHIYSKYILSGSYRDEQTAHWLIPLGGSGLCSLFSIFYFPHDVCGTASLLSIQILLYSSSTFWCCSMFMLLLPVIGRHEVLLLCVVIHIIHGNSAANYLLLLYTGICMYVWTEGAGTLGYRWPVFDQSSNPGPHSTNTTYCCCYAKYIQYTYNIRTYSE